MDTPSNPSDDGVRRKMRGGDEKPSVSTLPPPPPVLLAPPSYDDTTASNEPLPIQFLQEPEGFIPETHSEEESVSTEECLPPAPDGGFGWVVVVASFILNMLVDGVCYTFGVFLVTFLEEFGEGASKTAWVGSVCTGMYLMSGPLASALANKFGCRVVGVVGCVLASAAFFVSTFSSSVNMLILSWGFFGGQVMLLCEICGIYIESRKVAAHFAEHHPGLEEFNCGQCNFKGQCLQSLTNHNSRKHNPPDRRQPKLSGTPKPLRVPSVEQNLNPQEAEEEGPLAKVIKLEQCDYELNSDDDFTASQLQEVFALDADDDTPDANPVTIQPLPSKIFNREKFEDELKDIYNLRNKQLKNVIKQMGESSRTTKNTFSDQVFIKNLFMPFIELMMKQNKCLPLPEAEFFRPYIDEFKDLLVRCSSKYRVMTILQNLNVLVDHEYIEYSFSSDAYGLERKKGVKIDIREILTKILSIPDVANHLLGELKRSQKRRKINEPYQSYLDGATWNRIEENFLFSHKLEGEIAVPFPVKFYNDDFNVNKTPTHNYTHKIAGNYFIILGLHPMHNASLSYIFLAELFYSEIRKLSNNLVFKHVVDDFIDLAKKGIKVKHGTTNYRFYPLLLLCSGDNLSINQYLGFSESFTHAFPCRFCTIPRKEYKQFWELPNSNFLRNPINFERDLNSDDSKAMGIQPIETPFNDLYDITGFHATLNFLTDGAHDFQGILSKTLPYFLHNWIYVQKRFDMKYLNDKIKNFPYPHSSAPIRFKADEFSKLSKINPNKTLMYEMQGFNLILALPHMIAEKFELLSNERREDQEVYWKAFKLLHRITLIALAPKVTEKMLRLLKGCIKLFLEFVSTILLDGDKTMAFKFHVLVHYPDIIRESGPLYHMMTMRQESKHQELKGHQKLNKNFINICSSMANKQKICQAVRFLDMKTYNNLEQTRIVILKERKTNYFHSFDKELSGVLSKKLKNVPPYLDVIEVDKLTVDGTVIKRLDCLFNGFDEVAEEPLLFIAQRIFLIEEDFYVVCTDVNVREYSYHLNAYLVTKTMEVQELNKSNSYLLKMESVYWKQPIQINKIDYEGLVGYYVVEPFHFA